MDDFQDREIFEKLNYPPMIKIIQKAHLWRKRTQYVQSLRGSGKNFQNMYCSQNGGRSDFRKK